MWQVELQGTERRQKQTQRQHIHPSSTMCGKSQKVNSCIQHGSIMNIKHAMQQHARTQLATAVVG